MDTPIQILVQPLAAFFFICPGFNALHKLLLLLLLACFLIVTPLGFFWELYGVKKCFPSSITVQAESLYLLPSKLMTSSNKY